MDSADARKCPDKPLGRYLHIGWHPPAEKTSSARMKHWRALASIRLGCEHGLRSSRSRNLIDQRTRRVQAVLFLVVPAGLNVQLSEFCLQELAVNVFEPLDQRALLVRDHTQVSDQGIVIERGRRKCSAVRSPTKRRAAISSRYGEGCQSALDWDPRSASKGYPFDRRVLMVALAASELAGIAETARARVV